MIYEIPRDKKYWLIKTDNGDIYEHFIKYGVMAIGHLDILNFSISPDQAFYPNRELLERHLRSAHEKEKRKKGYTTSHLSQIDTFIYKINVGDWVIAKGPKTISVGRVYGSPIINKLPYLIEKKKKEKSVQVEMNYSLRRAVKWGPEIEKSHIPYPLKYSLGAMQSLYCIDKHAVAIHHMLYPYFKCENELYLSFKILKKSDIDNYSVTNLLSFLNELEVISKTIDLKNIYSREDFSEEFESFVDKRLFEISTKAGFYSEGDIWVRVACKKILSSKYMLNAVAIYAMLFGNSFTGMDGIIDVESRQKLWGIVAQRLEENFMDDAIKKLQLESPNYDTKSIESADSDENPDVKALALKKSQNQSLLK